MSETQNVIEQPPSPPGKISRRELLKRGITAVGILAFPACQRPFIPIIPIENPTPLSKEQLKTVYEETEIIVNKLRAEITGEIAGSPYKKDEEALLAPLNFYEANKKDPFFSFGFLDPRLDQNASAAYDNFNKIIFLRPNFLRSITSLDIVAALSLYHELEHAFQDHTIRVKYADNPEFLEQYLKLYDPKIFNSTRVANSIAEFEQIAYMKEITILDLLSKGKLKEELKKENKGSDFPDKQTDLYVRDCGFGFFSDENDRKRYARGLNFVFQAAGVAFSSDSTLDKLSDPYREFIVDRYRNGPNPHKIFTIHLQDGSPSLKEI